MKTGSIIRVFSAIVLCSIGILGSVQLKISSNISEWSFDFFIIISIIVGLIIFFSDRVTHFSFGLNNLEVTLEEMRETEASVKDLGKAILAVVEASSHSVMLESFDDKAYKESIARLKKLIA